MTILKTVYTKDKTQRIELWKRSEGYLKTVFFLDLYTTNGLEMRQNYDSFNDAIDAYYKLVQSAYSCGFELIRGSGDA